MSDWNIDRTLGQCCGNGRQIEPNEDYYAALVETQEGLKRRDFSAEFWDQQKPEVYCFWRTKLPLAEQKKKLFIDDDMLMAFFERLVQETEQEKINFRFVLALVLMRKRLLKYESQQLRDGLEVWRMKVAGTKDFADVVNPHLDESKIEELSSQMGEILQVDLEQQP